MERLEAFFSGGRDQEGHHLPGPRRRVSLVRHFLGENLPVDPAWVAILLCGVPILLEAIIGLVTAFDIKADVLVSMALVASVLIGEDFAAGEVAFIMQLGGLFGGPHRGQGPGGD